MRLLLDSNAYTEFKKGKPEAIEILEHASYIGLDSIVVGELLAGFLGGTRREQNHREFEKFCSSSRVHRFGVDDRTAEYYAKVFVDLKRQGKPIPTNDVWIAASALQHALSLFTYDGHFQYVTGLVVGRKLDDFLA
jgi:tRNA(fMet)-specific endonuclease VapC